MNESLKSSVPEAQRKPHWILRIIPPRYRQRITRVALIVGSICSVIWMFAAFAGLFFGPLAFAVWRPETFIFQPVLWLRRVSGPDAFILTYGISMLVIIGVIYTGHTFRERANPHP